MKILGISAHHRDAAAALLVDGQVTAAAREEHFTGTLHDPAMPARAIRFCLRRAGIRPSELDQVVFYEKPLRKFERVLLQQLKVFPRSAGGFVNGAFAWLGNQLWIKNHLAKELGVAFDKVLFVEHQLALAANAYYTSPFDEAAVLTIDDAGEWATSLAAAATDDDIRPVSEVLFPHSLGLVASALTQFLGFTPGRDEPITEALAPFGTPRYAEAFRELIPAGEGGFAVEQSAFRFAFDSDQLYDDRLQELLGPPRQTGDPLLIDSEDTRHADIACSLQTVLGERVLGMLEDLHERAPSTNLCLAGQLASNRRLVAQITQAGPFSRVFIPDAPGKSGGALGAALYAYHAQASGQRTPRARPCAALGEAVDNRAEPTAQTLRCPPEEEILRRLLSGEQVAWVRGRVEFGRCSLSNRLVLALPTKDGSPARLRACMQDTEAFLARRLCMPEEFADAALSTDPERDLTDLLARAQIRVTTQNPALRASSECPAGTICPQVVTATNDPALHSLLARIGEQTALPVLQVEDFALRGSPVVRTEAAAVEALHRSRLDCLVVEDRIYERRAM